VSPAYTIAAGTPLRAATGHPVPVLGPPTGGLLNPATFSPAKLGSGAQNIRFTQGPTPSTIGVDGITASHDVPNYETAPHLGSTRYAKPGDTLELSLTNSTQAHHPFHLHGFSMQPQSLSNGVQTFTWPYPEFRDNVDVPPGFTLTFRIRIDPRPQPDGHTPGGELGRWLFHCHIFFHATLGMLSELVVTAPNGRERPDMNLGTTQVTVRKGQIATVNGTYFDIDNERVRLSSSVGSIHKHGPGKFRWRFRTSTARSQFVYLTATNADGSTGQIPFFLKVTPPRLSAVIGKRVHLSHGAISVGCRVLHPSIHTCKVSAFSGGKRVAHESARRHKRGKRAITVKVQFSQNTQERISKRKHGLKLSVHLSATRFGSRQILRAKATTIALSRSGNQGRR
jgi:Multicopper oxidase